MKIKDILSSKEYCISFEFFPPKEENIFKEFSENFNFYGKLEPDFVSVTYGAGGSTKEKTFNLVKFIKEHYNFPVMPHLTSLTHTPEEIMNILLSYKEIGIENILALRGDVPKGMENFDISKAHFKDALTLIKFIKNEFDNTFSIGVSAYPEGYPTYKDLDKEVIYLKQKFDEGGDFAITQMFFDNSYFYKFIDICNKKGITNDIIPGIMPITNFKQIFSFATNVGTEIPKSIAQRFENIENPEEAEKIGIEVAVSQIIDLFENGFKKVHIYTLNRKSIVETITLAIKTKISLT